MEWPSIVQFGNRPKFHFALDHNKLALYDIQRSNLWDNNRRSLFGKLTMIGHWRRHHYALLHLTCYYNQLSLSFPKCFANRSIVPLRLGVPYCSRWTWLVTFVFARQFSKRLGTVCLPTCCEKLVCKFDSLYRQCSSRCQLLNFIQFPSQTIPLHTLLVYTY